MQMQRQLLSILLIVFCLIVSIPIYHAGFVSDDNLNSLLRGSVQLFHGSLWDYIKYDISIWLAYGRFFPLNVLSSDAVFYLFPHIHDYQLVRITFVWLSVAAFSWLLNVITKNIKASLLIFILFPLCWSIRFYSDPLISYAIFLPLLAIFTAIAVGSYIKYTEQEKLSWLILSIIMYGCALATYELGVIVLVLITTVALIESPRKLLPLRFHFYLTFFYIVINIRLHHQQHVIYNGISIKLSALMFKAFLYQASAALPLSYYLFAHLPTMQFHITVITSILFLLGTLIIRLLLQNLSITKSACKLLLILGLLLWLMPAALIAINAKYQLLVRAGIGYILVYIQYFGMAFVFLCIVAAANSYLSAITRFILSISLSLILTFSVSLNTSAVTLINAKMWKNRQLVEAALCQHFFTNLPSHSNLIEKIYLWNNREFYLLNGGVTFNDIIDINDLAKITATNDSNQYVLYSYVMPNSTSGYIILGRLTQLKKQIVGKILTVPNEFTLTQPKLFIAAKSNAEYRSLIADIRQHVTIMHGDIVIPLALWYRDGVMKDSWSGMRPILN